MKPVWCVAYRDSAGKGWCATERGRRPDPSAWGDATRCGMTVTLRIGSAIREPTCPECIAKMTAPRKARKGKR